MQIDVPSLVKILAIFIIGTEADVLQPILVQLGVTEDGFDIRVHTS
jgi:hypothetical protein